MAELVTLKKEDLKRSLNSLNEVLILEYSDIHRDSALMRFELATELAWKTLKLFLQEEFGVESPYPVTTYREALKAGLLNDTETETALQMAKDRNRMVHDYNEEYANELFKRIKNQYYGLLQTIYGKV